MSIFGSLPPGDLAWLAGGLMLAGVVTGVLAGLFGVGGGAVIVPVLAELFDRLDVRDDVEMHLAVGTSLAIIIPTSIRAYYSHRSHGQVDEEALRLWIVPVALGAALGVAIAAFATSDALKLVFAVFAVSMSANLLFGPPEWRLSENLPAKPLTALAGGSIGVLSAIIGIGGGALGEMFLTAFGRPIHRAIGTSAGLGALISIPGAIGYALAGWPHMADLPPLSIGYVSLLGLAVLAPVSVLVAPLGVRLARGLTRPQLRAAFGCFLALVAVRLIWDLAT